LEPAEEVHHSEGTENEEDANLDEIDLLIRKEE